MSNHQAENAAMINFHEIRFRTEFILWFKCVTPIPPEIVKGFDYEKPVDFFIEDNVCYLSCQNGAFATSLKLRPMQEENSNFEFIIQRSCFYLTLFQKMSSSGEILLRFLFTNGTMLRGNDIEIALTPKLFRNLCDKFNCNSESAITNALWKELMFELNGSRYFIFDGDVAPLTDNLPNVKDEQQKFAFSIVGNRHKLSITSSHIGSKQILLAYAWRPNNTLRKSLCTPSIFKGAWHCKQHGHMVKEIQDNLFEKRYQAEDSYFRNWNEYMNKYLDFILDSARKAESYKITDCSPESKAHREYKLHLDKKLKDDFRSFDGDDDISIWITPEVPPYISDKNLSGCEYLDELLSSEQNSGSSEIAMDNGIDSSGNESSLEEPNENSTDEDDENVPENSATDGTRENGESNLQSEMMPKSRKPDYNGTLHFPKDYKNATVKRISRDSTELCVTLQSDSPPRIGENICLSLVGHLTNAKRCFAARNSIQKGTCGNSQLRAIIENLETFNSDIGDVKKHKLSPYVENKIFPKYKPTSNQRDAIERALNTPDILLIQGPPGTGKTTVIAAIIESLNELHDAQKNGCGEILVSAFQHAAVDNIVSRLSINDLPGYKFGLRNMRGSTETLKFDPQIFESWRTEAIKKMESHYDNLKECQMLTELQSLYLKYITMPTAGCALKILNFLWEQATSSEMLEFRPRIDALRMRYGSANLTRTDAGLEYQHLVRALRTEENSFADDGTERAYELKFSPFAHHLSGEQRALLDQAANWLPGDSLDFLPKLKSLKEELLLRFIAVPEGNALDADDELCTLYNRCSEILAKEHTTSVNECENIIRDLYLNLKNSPLRTRDALQSYTFAFAATVQKAADKGINLLRGDEKSRDIRFDTVIVDEAARANPPDLLIPMSQAVNRIILVGDHRQLPHIIEEEVLKRNEREFEQVPQQGNASDKSEKPFLLNPDILKHSLFQHLWEQLKNTNRVITLNSQFRMHPLLGNFVSKHFYEKQGDDRVESKLSPQECRHGLSDVEIDGLYEPYLEKKALVWFDVQGEKDKSDGSRYRECEARALVRKLKSWMDSDAGLSLSFGVITFYRSQVREINRELDRIGIGINAARGEFKAQYKYLSHEGEVTPQERLQIGTVDAFQGKEFDVVLLSLVHSASPKTKVTFDADGKRLFNRICTSEEMNASRNLLCVALSRQKKLLAVFGDKKLFASEAAKKHSNELYELLKLSDVENNGDLGEYERL